MLALRPRLSLAALIAILLVPASAAAQAFTPPARLGSVTFGWQWIDNTGHIFSDGSFGPFGPGGQSVTTSVLAEVDYGVTERLAATVAIPFVFARYTGRLPPFSGRKRDACRCWHQSFQDFSIGGRYRFGDGNSWALTPQVRVVIPSHDYPYQGEAVVGPNLNQVLFGISGAWRFAPALPNATIYAGYNFALVEKVADLRPNRSSLFTSFGYALPGSLYVHGGALFQKIHQGLTVSDIPTAPADQLQQGDRLLKMRYWHLTGGLSYSATDFVDLFFSVQPYVWGRDTHDGIAYNVGATWYFDLSRPVR